MSDRETADLINAFEIKYINLTEHNADHIPSLSKLLVICISLTGMVYFELRESDYYFLFIIICGTKIIIFVVIKLLHTGLLSHLFFR